MSHIFKKIYAKGLLKSLNKSFHRDYLCPPAIFSPYLRAKEKKYHEFKSVQSSRRSIFRSFAVSEIKTLQGIAVSFVYLDD